MSTRTRPLVLVVAEAAPMRGGIATFAETITADPRLLAEFDMRLVNTARTADREGGRLALANVRFVLEDALRVWRGSRQADLVHLQLVADPGLPVLRAAALCAAARLGGAGVLAHSHSAVGNAGRREIRGYRWFDRIALRSLRLADLVLTVAEAGSATLRPLLGATPVRTVDNAVDTAAFPAATVGTDPPTVLFVGVICRRKGVSELVQAGVELRARGLVDWRLVLVGGRGPTPQLEYDELVREVRDAGFGDSLVGPEHGSQVKARLGASQVFVLPSFLEGQPIAVLEAMACGLPVVATAIGAVPQLVRDGQEGRVVEPGDVAALADALGELLEQPRLRVSMGAAARARAVAGHDLVHLGARLEQAYREVLSARRRTAELQEAHR